MHRLWRYLVLLSSTVTAIACPTGQNPIYCDQDNPCGTGLVCNRESNRCQPAAAADARHDGLSNVNDAGPRDGRGPTSGDGTFDSESTTDLRLSPDGLARDSEPIADGGPDACVPQCQTTNPCGPNGCNGSCGACDIDSQCLAGECEPKPAIFRASLSEDGSEATDRSRLAFLSRTGRFVAFQSRAALIADDSNGEPDVFRYDTIERIVACASVDSTGTPAGHNSDVSSMSLDGALVVFQSEAEASLLVPGSAGNARIASYIRDMRNQRTTRFAIGDQSGDITANAVVSPDGLALAASSVVGAAQIYSSPLTRVEWQLISAVDRDTAAGNGSSTLQPHAVSNGGRYVVFQSAATNLVDGDDNALSEVFLRNTASRPISTRRLALNAVGETGNDRSQSPVITPDGSYIAFVSKADNLTSAASKMHNIYLRRRDDQASIVLITGSFGGGESNGDSFYPSLSADGRFVVFFSDATNLVDTDTNEASDVFVHDRQRGLTERVSKSTSGEQGNGPSVFPTISADGRYIAFHSEATNLVSDDGNGVSDVFVARNPLR